MRFIKARIAACVTIALFSSAPIVAHGQNTPFWKTVGNWQIRVDTSLNDGCFMGVSFQSGDFLRVGFDRKSAHGYVLIGNSAWRSLIVGGHYNLIFQFDNYSSWNVEATGILIDPKTNATVFLYAPFNQTNFLKQLASSQEVTVGYSGRTVTEMALDGSDAAVQELIRCQQSIEASKSPQPGDPFAGDGQASTGSDPFSR